VAKKTLKRVHRDRKISTEQAARDAELRHKILHEFPPLEHPAAPVLSKPLRAAILRSKKSTLQLARKAHVSKVILDQFMAGQRDLRLATAERLAEVLGLKLVGV
jgi:Helix-turn-helix